MQMGQEFKRTGNKIESEGLALYFRTNGEVMEIPEKAETYYYSYDACDGRRETGIAKANHEISLCVKPGQTEALEIIYEMEPGMKVPGRSSAK